MKNVYVLLTMTSKLKCNIVDVWRHFRASSTFTFEVADKYLRLIYANLVCNTFYCFV